MVTRMLHFVNPGSFSSLALLDCRIVLFKASLITLYFILLSGTQKRQNSWRNEAVCTEDSIYAKS